VQRTVIALGLFCGELSLLMKLIASDLYCLVICIVVYLFAQNHIDNFHVKKRNITSEWHVFIVTVGVKYSAYNTVMVIIIL